MLKDFSFEKMTDLLIIKNELVIIFSILFTAHQWKIFYLKSTNQAQLIKEINFEEIFAKLKLEKQEIYGKTNLINIEFSKKILGSILII